MPLASQGKQGKRGFWRRKNWGLTCDFCSFFIILISYPLGKLMAKLLPESIHPGGTFTKKNHALVAILVSSGSSAAYGGEIISVQSLFYHYELSTIAGLLLLLTSQAPPP